MSRPLPARKNERGLTLLETVVALAIIFIVFLGLTDAGLLVMEYNIRNTLRDEAVSVSDNVMALTRQTRFALLDAEPKGIPVALDNVVREIRGLRQNYRRSRTFTGLNTETLQVRVDVSWDRRGRTYDHQATTIVRNR